MATISGIGVDLVEIARLRRLLAGAGGDGLRTRIFTADELARAEATADPLSHLAACFAAKEACGKAFGCGIAPPVEWSGIGVVPENTGRSALELTGATARHFATAGGGRLLLSLGCAGGYAYATVLLER